MSYFYFDVQDGEQTVRDDEGTELASWEAARCLAVRSLSGIARDVIPQSGDHRDITVDVRDENDRVVFTAQVSFTARRVGQRPPFP